MPKYDVIQIFQDGGRDGSILLPVSYLLLPTVFGMSKFICKPNFVDINSWLR